MSKLISITLVNPHPEDISSKKWIELCNEVFDYAREISPVDTGKFKSSWDLIPAGNKVTIYNPVDYGEFLNEGSSSQAPDGLENPIREKMEELVEEFMSSIPEKSEDEMNEDEYITYRNKKVGRK